MRTLVAVDIEIALGFAKLMLPKLCLTSANHVNKRVTRLRTEKGGSQTI